MIRKPALVALVLILLILLLGKILGSLHGPKIFPTFKRLDYNVAPFHSNISEYIPQVIWSYWDDDNPPDIVKRCWRNWKVYNSDHQVIILNRKSLKTYISSEIPSQLKEQRPSFVSDWVRLAVLKENGGIWMDASLLLTESLSHIHLKQRESKTEGFMFFLDYWTHFIEYPVYESWFIATIPNGEFISAWFAEFNRIMVEFNMSDEYLEHLKKKFGQQKYAEIIQGIAIPDYVKIHVALQKAMQIDGAPGIYGESAEKGPLRIQAESDWNCTIYAKKFIGKYELDLPKIIKLRSDERNALVELLQTKVPLESSIYHKYLNF